MPEPLLNLRCNWIGPESYYKRKTLRGFWKREMKCLKLCFSSFGGQPYRLWNCHSIKFWASNLIVFPLRSKFLESPPEQIRNRTRNSFINFIFSSISSFTLQVFTRQQIPRESGPSADFWRICKRHLGFVVKNFIQNTFMWKAW